MTTRNNRTAARRDRDDWRYASAAVSFWGLLIIAALVI